MENLRMRRRFCRSATSYLFGGAQRVWFSAIREGVLGKVFVRHKGSCCGCRFANYLAHSCSDYLAHTIVPGVPSLIPTSI